MKRKILLASTSTTYGTPYLSYLTPALEAFFNGVEEILFIPYARPSGITHEAYTQKAVAFFAGIGKQVRGIHQFANPQEALWQAQAIFVGGGNTFLLLSQLYSNGLMPILREKVQEGTPYMGTSAGINIAGQTINTTNDMPIVYPPSFEALGLVPFNLNPHYLDADPSSQHMGETRQTRIEEFHTQSDIPVIGLREGSYLQIENGILSLKGSLTARIFQQGKPAFEWDGSQKLPFWKI